MKLKLDKYYKYPQNSPTSFTNSVSKLLNIQQYIKNKSLSNKIYFRNVKVLLLEAPLKQHIIINRAKEKNHIIIHTCQENIWQKTIPSHAENTQ